MAVSNKEDKMTHFFFTDVSKPLFSATPVSVQWVHVQSSHGIEVKVVGGPDSRDLSP